MFNLLKNNLETKIKIDCKYSCSIKNYEFFFITFFFFLFSLFFFQINYHDHSSFIIHQKSQKKIKNKKIKK